MYLKVLDIDKFVKINNLKEIKDPIYLQFKRPTPEGLFSQEIFGITQYDRSTIWGYIDLGEKFLHPLAALNFKRYSAVFENIIYGLKKYRIEDGAFIPDEENGDTGIDFLYNNYEKIKWRETSSLGSQERIKFLSQGKDKLFITKFPVCPPFYRDINDNSTTGIPVVNELYKKIISQTIALKKKGGFSFFGNLTKANIQRNIVEIFNHYVGMLKGKMGLLRQGVLAHNVDYGCWGVLSSPVINCDKYSDMQVDFDHIGLPLPMVLSLFKPFILKSTLDFFANEFVRSGDYIHTRSNGDKMVIHLIDPMAEFSEDFIDKKITYFINGYSTRFDPIPLPKNKEGIEATLRMTAGVTGTERTVYDREMTWTDIFYQVAVDVTKDKSVVWSRYPIEHFYSIEYPKVRVLSTIQTIEAEVAGTHYKWYPVVKPRKDSSADFCATIVPCNVNIGSLGADYDGDSTPIRGIFTTEGNLDAEMIRRDKKNFLNMQGRNIRTSEKDFGQMIYSLTKAPKYVELEDPN